MEQKLAKGIHGSSKLRFYVYFVVACVVFSYMTITLMDEGNKRLP